MAISTPFAQPSRLARTAGAFYLFEFIAGTVAAIGSGDGREWLGRAALLAASGAYVVVTLLLYRLFKPVNPALSLIAAICSLIGCVVSVFGVFHISSPIDPLVFFGIYCASIGYIILRSTFLPKTLGVLMIIAGLGWLTFASPDLAHRLSPFNMLPGVVGEGALTLWLLIAGVDDRRWMELK